MNIGLKRIPTSEFVRRAIERTGTGNWFLLASSQDEVPQLAMQISTSIKNEIADDVVRVIHPDSADAVASAVIAPSVAVVSEVDEWTLAEWARMDVLRSRLLPISKVVWVVSSDTASRFFAAAPHFARFFGGSAWEAELDADEMSDAERQGRIQALERWAQMSTDDMLEKAKNRELPDDPRYAEWLVLAKGSDFL